MHSVTTMDILDSDIIDRVRELGKATSSDIHSGLSTRTSLATVKRTLARLVDEQLLSRQGRGKSTRYSISPSYGILQPIDLETYFRKEIDEREIYTSFNLELISRTLADVRLFTDAEVKHLDHLQAIFTERIFQLTGAEYSREMERLAIDLSWKSSQIEGNTYSLLETELLLKEKITAYGKTKEEACMLLNHKECIDEILDHPDYVSSLTISKIEDLHRILIKDLGIDTDIRKRRIGISGTNYRPLDNEFKISEALRGMCDLVNAKEKVFEKALLTLALISYIQPFMDGNKRTARIASNAVLMSHQYCPLSYRTVDSAEYKKAMLLFYECNNISAIKQIFIDQFEFAVNTYF